MPPGPDGSGKDTVQSVVRACEILMAFSAERPELSLGELTEATGLRKTTVHRLASTLTTTGFLASMPGGRYRLGTRLFQLGAVVDQSLDLRGEAREVMEELAAETGDTVFLTVIEDGQAMCVERVHGSPMYAFNMMPVGGTLPLHVSAGPTVLLAYHEDSYLRQVLESGPVAYTPLTIVDPEAIRRRLRQVRHDGFSYAEGDVIPDIAGYGAPVFDGRGDVVAALSVGGLVHRFGGTRGRQVRESLLRAAALLSQRMGHDHA